MGLFPPHGGGGTELFWGCSPSMVGGATGHILDTFFCHLFPPTVEGEQPQNGKMTSFLGENPPKSRFLGQNRENTSFFGQNFGFGPPHSWGGPSRFFVPPPKRVWPPPLWRGNKILGGASPPHGGGGQTCSPPNAHPDSHIFPPPRLGGGPKVFPPHCGGGCAPMITLQVHVT